ncbi:hypothetical protein KA005_01740 [bacterium]|nr:hypothetical protein [bacterium]
MRMIFIVLMAGLVGCSIPPFKPTEHRKHIELTIVIDDDLSWMGKDYGKHKAAGGVDCDGSKCTMWVPSITSLDDPNFRVWGKEAAHLFYGYYHKGITDIY